MTRLTTAISTFALALALPALAMAIPTYMSGTVTAVDEAAGTFEVLHAKTFHLAEGAEIPSGIVGHMAEFDWEWGEDGERIARNIRFAHAHAAKNS